MSEKKNLDGLKKDSLNTSEVKGGKSSFSKASSIVDEQEATFKLADQKPKAHFKGDIAKTEKMKSTRLSGPDSDD